MNFVAIASVRLLLFGSQFGDGVGSQLNTCEVRGASIAGVAEHVRAKLDIMCPTELPQHSAALPPHVHLLQDGSQATWC